MSQNHQDPAVPDLSDGEHLPPVEITLKAQIRPDVTIISVSDDNARVSIVSEVFLSSKATTGTNQPGQSHRVRYNDEPEVQERPDDYSGPSVPAKISAQALYQACAKSPSYLSRDEIKEILLKSKEDDEKFIAKELGSHTPMSQISLKNSDSPWSPRKSPDQAARPTAASSSSHESLDSDWLPGDKRNPFRGKVLPVPIYQEDLIDFETEIPNQMSDENNGRSRAEKKPSRGKAKVQSDPIDDGDFKDKKTDKTSRARRDSGKFPENKQHSFIGRVSPAVISEEDVEEADNDGIADKPVYDKSMTPNGTDSGQHEKPSTSQDERRGTIPSPRQASEDRQSKLAGKASATVRFQNPPTPPKRGRLPSIIIQDTVTGTKQTEFDGKKIGRHLHLPGLVAAKEIGQHFKKKLPKLATLPKRMMASMNKLRGVHAMKVTPKMRGISLDMPQPKPQDSRTGLSREAFARLRKEKVAAANAEWGQMEGPGTPEKPSDNVQFADRSDLRLYWEKSKTLWRLFKTCSMGEK